MARVTVEDCLDHLDNRFDLVLVSSARARQLANGQDAFVDWENDKPTVVALREIAEGYVDRSILEKKPAPEDMDAAAIDAATAEAVEATQGAEGASNAADA